MSNSVDYRIVLVCAAAILLLALRFLRLDQSPAAPDPGQPHQEVAASDPSPATSSGPDEKPAYSGGSQAVFTPRMPINNSVNIVANNGQYRLNSVRVAVPNAFHDLQYLPGTDPAAVKYLDDTRAAEQKLTMDNGPLDADTSSNPPPGVNASKRVGVVINNK